MSAWHSRIFNLLNRQPLVIGWHFVAQDLLEDYRALVRVRNSIRGKGIKGAVGTSASYTELLHGTDMTPREHETLVMQSIDLLPFEIAHQTYPRRQDWDVLNALSGFAMSAYKFRL